MIYCYSQFQVRTSSLKVTGHIQQATSLCRSYISDWNADENASWPWFPRLQN